MKIIDEFRDFAVKGNVIDMAVGVVIGTAFGKIVSSFVNDIIMPPIGVLIGNVDFTDLVLTIKEKTAESAAVTINYGAFINNILDFLIIAFSIFFVIKQLNRFKRTKEAAPATTKECPKCFSVINIKATRCPCCTAEI
ncbi:MAG: large-conductance mechanosensitive channel protein MscL [Campylobacteraceae bacterium]